MTTDTSAVIYGIKGTGLGKDEADFFKDIKPYGYILFARNIESPEQVKRVIGELKSLGGDDRLPILIDQEGGRVARLKPPHWRKYPPAATFASLAASDKNEAVRAVYCNARLIAQELYELGITVDCAPVADLPVAGAHDVIGDRAFGYDAQQVITLAQAQADGLMDGGIVPVLKHIPGHGRALCDSHHDLPVVEESLEILQQTDFVPFRALANLPMAMTAHVLYNAIDKNNLGTVSPTVIRLIREDIGFSGLLMSDDISMKAMKGSFAERARDALKAGCDVVLHCNGDMKEMVEIARGVTPLSGLAFARAGDAMRKVGGPKEFDVAEATALISDILSKAA
jgi:beta-N-acetylhexosaminidase